MSVRWGVLWSQSRAVRYWKEHDTGFKIVANVNSHQFLPKISNPATVNQETVLIQPYYKGLLYAPILPILYPKGRHVLVFPNKTPWSLPTHGTVTSVCSVTRTGVCIYVCVCIYRDTPKCQIPSNTKFHFSGSTLCPSQQLKQTGRLGDVRNQAGTLQRTAIEEKWQIHYGCCVQFRFSICVVVVNSYNIFHSKV